MPRLSKEQVAEESARCYELRLTGASVRQIVQVTGYSQGKVERRLQQAIDNRVSPLAEEYRQTCIDRATRLLLKCEAGIAAGDMKAIQTAAKLISDLYRYNGLESITVKHTGTVITESSVDAELRSLANELGLQDYTLV